MVIHEYSWIIILFYSSYLDIRYSYSIQVIHELFMNNLITWIILWHTDFDWRARLGKGNTIVIMEPWTQLSPSHSVRDFKRNSHPLSQLGHPANQSNTHRCSSGVSRGLLISTPLWMPERCISLEYRSSILLPSSLLSCCLYGKFPCPCAVNTSRNNC